MYGRLYCAGEICGLRVNIFCHCLSSLVILRRAQTADDAAGLDAVIILAGIINHLTQIAPVEVRTYLTTHIPILRPRARCECCQSGIPDSQLGNCVATAAALVH